MSVTYGFYNSIDHDRLYDAVQLSELFDGLISEGVYENVYRSGSASFRISGNGYKNQVTVDKGRAWFAHTWTYNDAPIIVALPDAIAAKYRCDAIIIDIDTRVNVRENKIIYVQGTSTTNTAPSDITSFVNSYKPALENTSTHRQIPLAYIERRPKDVEDASPNIADAYIKRVVGDAVYGCPYVAGLVDQTIDIGEHIRHWESVWAEWYNPFKTGVTSEMNTWKTTTKNYFHNDQETGVLDELAIELSTFVNNEESDFTLWRNRQQTTFTNWFNNLVYILDGDVAGHLQNEIDDISNILNPVPIDHGGTGNNEGYIHTGYVENDTPLGDKATSEGYITLASGDYSHAEGHGSEIIEIVEPTNVRPLDTYYSVYDQSNTLKMWSIQPGRTQYNGYYYAIVVRYSMPDGETIYSKKWGIGYIAYAECGMRGDRDTYVGVLDSDEPTSAGDAFYAPNDGILFENDDVKIYTEASDHIIHHIIGTNYPSTSNDVLFIQSKTDKSIDVLVSVSNITSYDVVQIIPEIINKITNPVVASGTASHAEGSGATASGRSSHAEGENTKASKMCSHAEGSGTTASGQNSHAEGTKTIASEYNSHAEGGLTTASGKYSHAEGRHTEAVGEASHSEGINSKAIGPDSHAGAGGIASLEGQFVHGCFGFGGKIIDLEGYVTLNPNDYPNFFNGSCFKIKQVYPWDLYLILPFANFITDTSTPIASWLLIANGYIYEGSNIAPLGVDIWTIGWAKSTRASVGHLNIKKITTDNTKLIISKESDNLDSIKITFDTTYHLEQFYICQLIRLM